MKKKTLEKLFILVWLILLSVFSIQGNKRIDWLQNQQDNVIEVLLTGE